MMSYTVDPQVQTMIDNMPEKTGKTLEAWFEIIKTNNLEKHGEIMKLLKGEYGVTHGYANTIKLIYREQTEGGSSSLDELVDAQYHNKAELKSWYNQLIGEIRQFGSDVAFVPKKAYVSLRRARQFGIIQPSTKSRMDIGINLKEATAGGVLLDGSKWGGMCSHRIEIHSEEDITAEVIDWLRKAYQAAG